MSHTAYEANPALVIEAAHQVDAAVVGMGVLGLIIAKRLVDFGQRVAVIEQSPTLADGPSIKNHAGCILGPFIPFR